MQSKLSAEELAYIIQWDIKNWKRALSFWDKHFEIKAGMRVLALGEREGGLSYYFAQKGCEVVCSDYNEFPDSTKKMHAEKGVSDQISYKQIDMRNIDFEDGSFDVVVFKSVIGALGNKEDQDEAIKEINRVLKKGGAFLFAENALGSRFHRYLRKKFVGWGERWRYITRQDLQDWQSNFSSAKTEAFGFSALFGRSEKQRSFLGGVDKAFNPLTPKGWRYIYFGVMVK